MEVDDEGICTVSSPSMTEKGLARVEAGVLVVQFTTSRGGMNLSLGDRQLQGVMVVKTRSSSVAFTRA